MNAKLKFRCPHCESGLSAGPKLAGRQVGCPGCSMPVTVPAVTALVPVCPPQTGSNAPQPYETTGRPARLRKRPKTKLTPVELRLPGQLGGMTANVDRKTSNAMATTFLGGLLVAVGAVLFAMFGGRSKSA